MFLDKFGDEYHYIWSAHTLIAVGSSIYQKIYCQNIILKHLNACDIRTLFKLVKNSARIFQILPKESRRLLGNLIDLCHNIMLR